MSKKLGYDSRNSSVICRVVLYGTFILVAAISILTFFNFHFVSGTKEIGPLAVCGVAVLYVGVTYAVLRRKSNAAAYLLLVFYTALASMVVLSWGINTPLGILLFGLVIVLAGVLLTAKHALFAAIASSAILMGLQAAIILNWYKPDTSWTSESSYGDVLAYCAVFGMLSLVSWLYNREMQGSLVQARQAEAALLIQKATLETQVKLRTDELRRAQLEEMRQMYRFAKLGQLGVALLHDLANYLTALNIEIEDIDRKQHSKTVTRARKIMQYLADIVYNTRERLSGTAEKQAFNIVQKTNETVAFMRENRAKAGVEIEWQSPKETWRYKGDPTSFCQVIGIIIANAIDAYGGLKKGETAKVVVDMQHDETGTTIHVSDWGTGIALSQRKNLFKPFNSTKEKGMGLGLYIARQTVEMEFSGSLIINPKCAHTEFIIKLPSDN